MNTPSRSRIGSCDLVIMNPPFTRPTNHEAGHAEIPVPSFAGFSTSHDEQQAMGRKLKNAAGLFSSGNAGLASNFMDLGHSKLKDGGVLALVIPFAFLRGKSWKGAREALQAHYSDVHVTSIAATGSTTRAFSADTGMAECLVVATKRGRGRSSAAYSNLGARPSSLLEAAVEAKNVKGRAVQGNILDAGAAGVRSMSVIQAARNLEAGNLRLPRSSMAVKLPVVTLGTVAERGLVHRDINGGFTDRNGTGLARGPFVVRSIRADEVPTYPDALGAFGRPGKEVRGVARLLRRSQARRRIASDRALESRGVPPARQSGLPVELTESRHVPHAGEVPRR